MKSMKFIRIAGLCLAAVFAMSAVVTASASAIETEAGGPVWVVPCHKVLAANAAKSRWEDSACSKPKAAGGWDKILFPGETRAIKSGGRTEFELRTLTATVVCKNESDTGELKGGNPGTDFTRVVFTGCTIAGKPECVATGTKPPASTKGEIITEAYTELAYSKGEAESTKHALDAFFPKEPSNVFAAFKLTESEAACGSLHGAETTVTATGTAIKQPALFGTEERKCGLLAEDGWANSKGGVFTQGVSGAQNTIGVLRFPKSAAKEAEHWNGTKFVAIECKLTAGALGAAEEIGESWETTELEEAFGWEK